MPTKAERFYALAKRQIENPENGYSGYIVREGAPTGPEHDPQPGVPAKHECWIVDDKLNLSNRPESLVKVGDRAGLLSPDIDVVPTMADEIELDDGVAYSFVDLEPVRVGGTVVMYTFLARK